MTPNETIRTEEIEPGIADSATQPGIVDGAREVVMAGPASAEQGVRQLGGIAYRQVKLAMERQQIDTRLPGVERVRRGARSKTDALRIATQGLISEGRRKFVHGVGSRSAPRPTDSL